MTSTLWSVDNILVTSFSIEGSIRSNNQPFWDQIHYDLECIRLQVLNDDKEDDRRDHALEILRLFEKDKDMLWLFSDEISAVENLRERLLVQLDGLLSTREAQYLNVILISMLTNVESYRTDRLDLKTGGIGGAKSIKLGNISSINIIDLLEAISGMLLIAGKDEYHANPFVICAGVLLVIHSLLKTAMVEISENDATVLWAFYKVKNRANIATQSAIIKKTIDERCKYNFEVISEREIMHALNTLETLKCVRKVEGHNKQWELLEKIVIRSNI